MEKVDKHQVHHKIRIKLWIYFFVFLISLLLSMIHYVNGHVRFYFPLGGFCSGVFIGFVASRMSKITWDHNGEVIITKLDWIGLAIFLVYVSFIAFKNTIIEDIVHLHNISSISLAVLSGTMLGHAFALRKRIINFYIKSQPVE